MKMNQTVAGVALRRSLGFWVGEIGADKIMVEKFSRGLYRWRVRRYQRSEEISRGVTLTEAIKQAKANLTPRSFVVGGDPKAPVYSWEDGGMKQGDPTLHEIVTALDGRAPTRGDWVHVEVFVERGAGGEEES